MLFLNGDSKTVKNTINKKFCSARTLAAKNLFAWLPEEIAPKLESAFWKNDYKGEDAQQVLEHLLKYSKIYKATYSCPGGGEAFHYLYTKEADNPVDQYFQDSPAGHQIYMRLLSMEQEIPKLLRSHFPGQTKSWLTILDRVRDMT